MKNSVLDFVHNVKTKGVAYLKERIKKTYEKIKETVSTNFIEPFKSRKGIEELIGRARQRFSGV